MESKAFTDLLTSIVALLTALVAIFKYFQYRSRQDKIRLVGQDFHAVITSLRSDNSIEQLAGAILLRRFHDPKTEMGSDRYYYSKEALNVAAAILRGQPTSDFQKLLADGLAFAPTLYRADLQKTNLQFAYLGSRNIGAMDESKTDLSLADFFRADLSRASLKGAIAEKAVFYQARLHNTVLKGANLTGANFFEADLKDAIFDGAILHGANFNNARNIPDNLQQGLDSQGNYLHATPCPRSSPQPVKPIVFISKPGYMGSHQREKFVALQRKLESQGLASQTLERADYPKSGAVAEVCRVMSGCAGAIVFGFSELRVFDGTWRAGTPEEKSINDLSLPTPWAHMEAGMALMQGIPLFVLHQKEVDGGIFNLAGDPGIHRACMDEDWRSDDFDVAFSKWSADVRERVGAGTGAKPSGPALT